MISENTRQTSWILYLGKQLAISFAVTCDTPGHLHKNDEQNDALEAEVLAKRIDEEICQEEGVLHEQHASVAAQRELHNGNSFPFKVFGR